MAHFSVMKKFPAYCLATVALVATTRSWAGPSTPDMASAGPSADTSSSVVELSPALPTFESLAPPSDLLANEFARDPFVDTADVYPNGPHPMIPLPPAVWAGFAGLAFIARRVLRGRPGA